MISIKFDTKEMNKKLFNISQYSAGFVDGIEMNKAIFDKVLAEYTIESLGEYIDSKARMNPKTLHHVYEWNKVGDKGSRLFNFQANTIKGSIFITGKFLPSTSLSENSTKPFTNKAEIMENKIAITVEPRNADVLSFEDEGETVFTRKSIYIASPGGDLVAGRFGQTVDEFFSIYFTNSILNPVINNMRSMKEFSNNFSQGSKYGRSVGLSAGKKYMTVKGVSGQ